MGLIKEPLDIDFYVDPKPLTDEERAIISQYILEYKAKEKRKAVLTTHPLKQVDERYRARI
jgi:hypothetical protein